MSLIEESSEEEFDFFDPHSYFELGFSLFSLPIFRPREALVEKKPVVKKKAAKKKPPKAMPLNPGYSVNLGVDNGLGLIEFTLLYHVAEETLKIFLRKANDLVARTTIGVCNPSAKIVLESKLNKDLYRVNHTIQLKKTNNPVWDMIFRFDNITNMDIRTMTLQIFVIDGDSAKLPEKRDYRSDLGSIIYPLNKMYEKISDNDPERNLSILLDLATNNRDVIFEDEESQIMGLNVDSPQSHYSQSTESSLSLKSRGQPPVGGQTSRKPSEEQEEQAAIHVDYLNERDLDRFSSSEDEDDPPANVVRVMHVKRFLAASTTADQKLGTFQVGVCFDARKKLLIVEIVKADFNQVLLKLPSINVVILKKEIENRIERLLQRNRTKTLHNQQSPVWKETFSYQIEKGFLNRVILDLEFYNTNSLIRRHELLGHLRLSHNSSVEQQQHWREMTENVGTMIYKTYNITS